MEGELNGCWRDLGIPGLWYMMGRSFYFSASLMLMPLCFR